MSDSISTSPKRSVVALVVLWSLRLLAVAVILGGGLFIRGKLASLRQPPARRVAEEVERVVETTTAHYAPELITLNGYGSVRLATVLPISPQVGGRVMRLYPNLEDGVTIPAGSELLAIDDRDLRLSMAQQQAELTRLTAENAVLEAELHQRQQFVTLRRETLELAEKDLARVQALRAAGDLATLSEVEAAQGRVLAQREAQLALQTDLAILPTRSAALVASRGRTEQMIAQLELDLTRCVIKAPFTGRVQMAHIELGQIVTPGQVLLQLADDNSRELAISLSAAQVTRWLRFRNGETQDFGWFHQLDQVPTEIRWVDAPTDLPWNGEVTRVEAYDENTRTLQVISRVLPSAAGAPPPYPLVVGMFCEVRIPGRTLPRAVRLPRHALQTDNRLFVIREGRLAAVPVTLADERGSEILINEGITEGDEVIVGKLLSPVMGMKVRSLKDGPAPAPAETPNATPASTVPPTQAKVPDHPPATHPN
jgi:membrane fusion protein, multidrug efflux system